jgi:hypothetical protein
MMVYEIYECTDSSTNYAGIISLELGPPQDLARTKGFDFGIVLCLENLEAFEGFIKHPAHLR